MCPVSVATSRSTQRLQTGEAKIWLLLVGIDRYQDAALPTLRYSAIDCQGVSEALLEATQSFPQQAVRIFHDRGADPPILDNIRNSLARIATEARERDTVLLYFSGHGILDPHTRQAVLCLADTYKENAIETGLSLAELLQYLDKCEARSQLVWLDACHSGGMTWRGARGERETLSNPTLQLVEGLRQRAARSRGFYAMLSCDRDQQSWEFPQLGHGVFTYYLMRGLRGEAADSQGIIEADRLYRYVYYQTLQYIDKTNQQLRLINQQKRSRGESQLQTEYPLQTPKRIVEGIGELILGIKPKRTELRHPRQALAIDGLGSTEIGLALSQKLRGAGGFEVNYFPSPGKNWTEVREAIALCLQGEEGDSGSELSTALLYLRGRIEETETGEACLVLGEEVRLSRSWLRQALRRSGMAQQIIVLDCPRQKNLGEWVEDLQINSQQGQCLIAAASPASDSEMFARSLLETLAAADVQVGLSVAGWIAQLQRHLSETEITPHIWLAGTQGAIDVLPGKLEGRGSETVGRIDLGLCPYMGLKAFGEEDTQFFFGRENLIRQLLDRFDRQPFLAIVGASGSGKSSLVHAGLIARLRQGKRLPGSESWWVKSMRPGAHPMEALTRRLLDSGTERERIYQQQQLRQLLGQGITGFVRWLRSRPEPMVVLVVDQFEEIFTLADKGEREQFLALILGAIELASDRFKVVITLRTDFIAPCLETPDLAKRVQQSSLLVSPYLGEEDYRHIIVEPAEKVGLKVEPELVEVLLQELSRGTGDLPLLEFVLERVWERRQPGELTLQVYQQQIGGLKGALERQAQAVYEGMDAQTQACARWIFLALTQLGEGTEDTRRRAFKSELMVAKYPPALVERTLQLLTAAKLIVVSLEAETLPAGQSRDYSPNLLESPQILADKSQEVTVEVAHEILIRHWSSLRQWLQEDRERLRTQRQIEQAASQWKQSGRQPDFLLWGVRLASAEEIYLNYKDELSQDVRQFIEAGLQAREKQQQQTKQQLQRARIAIALITLLAFTAMGFGAWVYRQRQEARFKWINSLTALSEALLKSNQPLESLLASVKAGQQLNQKPWFELGFAPTPDMALKTIASLQQGLETTAELNRLENHSQPVNSAIFSPDGGTIASGSDDKTIRLWQRDGKLLKTLKNNRDRVTNLAFSPNGKILAAAIADGTVNLWNPDDEKILTTLMVGKAEVTRVAFNPNGQILATADRDRQIKLWNVDKGVLLQTLTGQESGVSAVSFSPDGNLLASGSEDGTIKLWNLSDGKAIKTLTGHQKTVTSVAFSPDGKFLASSSNDGTIALRSVADDSLLKQIRQTEPITSLSFSRDGKRLASASASGTIDLWHLDGTLLKTLKGHIAAVTSVNFSPDGQTLISASADNTVRLWAIAPLKNLTVNSYAAQFSPDGNLFAVANGDGTIQLWDRNKQLVKTLKGHSSAVLSLSFSPDGKVLASGGEDKTIRLWDVDKGTLVNTLNGHGGEVNSVAFSPDGRLLASASSDRAIKWWNAKDGKLLQTLNGQQGNISGIAFSPDGKRLASSSEDKTIKFWATDGKLIKTLEQSEGAIASLSFSPDGQLLATANDDHTIKLWQVDKGTILQTLIGHLDRVTRVNFSPDGKHLVSGSDDGTIKLWNVTDGSPVKTLLGHPDAVSGVSFSSNGKTLISSSQAAGAIVWNLDLDNLLERGCGRLRDYLATNPTVKAADRQVCLKLSPGKQ